MPSPSLSRFVISSRPPPAFLAPCLAPIKPLPSTPQTALFSTTPTPSYPRDYNRNRGVSALRRTGPRQPLSVSKEPLPQPVLDPKKRDRAKVDENHGLWGFFNRERTVLSTPEEDHAHGRAWTVEEFRHKSWEDLHSLWWVCVRERNRLSTESWERDRLKAGYGEHEAGERERTVRRTQRAIKHALTERFYAWQEARQLAKTDPEVDLAAVPGGEGEGDGDGKRAYRSRDFEDESLGVGVGDGAEGRVGGEGVKGTVAL